MVLKSLCSPDCYNTGKRYDSKQPGYVRKIVLAMKLTAILMLSACLAASAKGTAQDITLSVRDVPLSQVITAIEKQSGINFIYGKNLINQADRVSLTVWRQPLAEVLEMIFRTQPLTFRISGNYVVISPKPIAPPTEEMSPDNQPPPIDITGRILNSKGEPVIATITVKGKRRNISTDDNGFFMLKKVDANATLLITGIGIESMEVPVSGRTDLGSLTVKTKSTAMDELQIIAYGTTSKRFNVGSVTTVKSADIQKQPVTNVLLAMQGRVPGMIITPTSGAPGAIVKVQVRGQNTLTSAMNRAIPFDQPLIIIDGVPFSPQNQNINLLSSMGAGTYGGNTGAIFGFGALSSLNPNDIESISVLRDADATSIYGSQGANGVILITTKKGKPGKTTFGVRVNTGPNSVTRRQRFMNTQQYLALRREAIANDGLTLPPVFDGTYPDVQLFDSTKYTDWFDKFLGGTSNNTDINASLTGGTDNISFIIGAGYNRSSYNFPGDFSENRYSFHSGFNYKSKNNKLTLDFGTDFSYGENNNASNPDASALNKLPPNTPELIDENGNLIWSYRGFGLDFGITGNSSVYYQQYAYLKQPYSMKKYNLINSMQVSYKILTGLSATVNIGYSRFTSSENAQYPIASQSPYNPYRRGNSGFTKNEFETVNIEPQVNYQLNIGKGVFTLLAGGTWKKNSNRNESIYGTDYTNDGFLGSLTGAGRYVDVYSNNIIYKYVGVYGRAGYIYDNKYIFNITGRRDGSSNFGPGKQFGNFASAGAGWIASEEKFFTGLRNTFSLVKLSANYGTNGSDGVEPYNYQDYWTVPQNDFYPNFQGIRPYIPMNLFNPNYSWASKKTLNVMLDLGLFNDKLIFNATWYRSRTSNQLVGAILPAQTGFTSVTANQDATVQNTGWEFALTSTNIQGKDFTWSSNANLSLNRNKLVAFPDLDKSSYAYYYTIGQSLSVRNAFLYKGVNETTGLFEFYDAKGNGTSNPDLEKDSGDLRPAIDLQPVFTGGIENTFTYKRFVLSVMFQFAKQTAENYLYAVYGGMGYQPGMHGNMPELITDRWKKPGDKSTLQRATTGALQEALNAGSAFSQSTGAVSDYYYARLKTLSLSWSFPTSIIKKAGMENMIVYVNMQNLLTITNYKFGDPELPGQLSSIPLQRTIAFGLMFNF